MLIVYGSKDLLNWIGVITVKYSLKIQYFLTILSFVKDPLKTLDQ